MSEVQAAKATSKCSCTTELTLKIMTAVNCVFAVIVCGLGIYKYSAGSIENFSQAFVPFYLIVFGVLLICAEMEWVFVVKYFKFLDNLMGRGAFNIYLATIVINELNVTFNNSSENPPTSVEVFTITLSSILTAIGFAYMIMWIARCGKKSQKYNDYDTQQQLQTLKQQQQQQIRQPLVQPGSPSPGSPSPGTPTTMTAQQWQQLQQNPTEYQKWLQHELSAMPTSPTIN